MGGGDRGIIILNKPVSVGVCARGGGILCVCTYSLTPHFQMRMSVLHCKRFVHPRTPYMKARYLPRLNYECVTVYASVCMCM